MTQLALQLSLAFLATLVGCGHLGSAAHPGGDPDVELAAALRRNMPPVGFCRWWATASERGTSELHSLGEIDVWAPQGYFAIATEDYLDPTAYGQLVVRSGTSITYYELVAYSDGYMSAFLEQLNVGESREENTYAGRFAMYFNGDGSADVEWAGTGPADFAPERWSARVHLDVDGTLRIECNED